MVYECPQCKTPLPPGVMACAKCSLQFATPIPADATMPAPGTLLPGMPQTTRLPSAIEDGAPPQRVVAVVAVLGVVLVAAVLFAIYTFSRTPVSEAPTPASITSTMTPPPSPRPSMGAAPRGGVPAPSQAPAGSLAPVQLSGGSGTSSGGAAAAGGDDAALQGRWQAKNMEFYVFNADGTGSRGRATNPAKSDNFTWVVTGSQLVLNGRKEERLTFSTGPDASVLYLRLPNGRYAKFTRMGAS